VPRARSDRPASRSSVPVSRTSGCVSSRLRVAGDCCSRSAASRSGSLRRRGRCGDRAAVIRSGVGRSRTLTVTGADDLSTVRMRLWPPQRTIHSRRSRANWRSTVASSRSRPARARDFAAPKLPRRRPSRRRPRAPKAGSPAVRQPGRGQTLLRQAWDSGGAVSRQSRRMSCTRQARGCSISRWPCQRDARCRR
jgi:hypothetical protein